MQEFGYHLLTLWCQAPYGLRVTSSGLRVAGCALRIAGCALRCENLINPQSQITNPKSKASVLCLPAEAFEAKADHPLSVICFLSSVLCILSSVICPLYSVLCPLTFAAGLRTWQPLPPPKH